MQHNYFSYSFLKGNVLLVYGRAPDLSEEDCLPFLSEKEIERAARFKMKDDRHRHIVSRARLKQILACLLQINENEIEFYFNKSGKPVLKNDSQLKFNLSHSAGVFVIGVSYENEIGVDVESSERVFDLFKLQDFLFSPGELNLFQNTFDKQTFFIDCWTKKEAILKAGGEGLTKPMNSFSVLTDSTVSGNTEGGERFLKTFMLLDKYRCAVAVKGRVKPVHCIPVTEFVINNVCK